MKLIKMRIRRDSSEGKTHYDYPVPYYDAYKVVFGPIYESGLPDNAKSVMDRDADDEFIVIGVKDEDFSGFMACNGVVDKSGHTWTAVELTQAEAETLGTSWTNQTEKITDQDTVIKILAKIGRGEVLTQKEQDALNPDSSEIGINKTKSFKDTLAEHITLYK